MVKLTYQFDIVDIIIVQSIFLRRAAQRLHTAMLFKKYTQSATAIQTAWRIYNCTMTYLHSIADILIVQSMVRSWIVMVFVPLYQEAVHNNGALMIQTTFWGHNFCLQVDRMRASIVIQSTLRGFQCYIDYIFTMADIVIVQRFVRQQIAKKTVATTRSAVSGDGECGGSRYSEDMEGILCTYGNVIYFGSHHCSTGEPV